MHITIVIEGHSLPAELDESSAGVRLSRALPLTARLSRWGQEYYGRTDVAIPLDATAREILEVGEIAWWPPGNAVCIFFGPTPASTDERPRAASPVVPLGRITSGLEELDGLGPSVTAEFRAK